ncbi:MAG: hypothetical protein E7671_02030 [Ruminococcaceae bacterium]|nr:hypothetical protein [Oscillospiraceae bacterium]
MKRFIICFTCVILVLFVCACGEAGVSVDKETLDVCSVGVKIGDEVIKIQKNFNEGGYTLYLPSFADGIVWSLEGSVLVNGKAIQNGDGADILLTLDNVDIEGTNVSVMRSEGLPTLFLYPDDGNMDKVNASPDHSYSTPGEYALVAANGEKISSGDLKKIRGRGNATWNGTEKKPYQIDLESAELLLGLAKAKKYVLLANYYDPSLMRNSLAFYLAIGCAEGYSPSFAHVDLYAAGEYLGSYLLCEKIEISEEKIDIFDLEDATEELLEDDPDAYERGGSTEGAEWGSSKWWELPAENEDVTGGYLLEVDYPERYPDEVSGFVTNRGLPIVISSPECASKAQVEYIKEYVCDFEDALYSNDGYNAKGKHYSDYADIDSLVFRYLFEEFVLNIDGGISSLYIYKDTEANGGKLNFSCVWDYDCALGNYNKYADLTSPETLFVASNPTRNNGTMPSWFYTMFLHEDIRVRVNEYYTETMRPIAISMLEYADAVSSEISASAKMDEKLYRGYATKGYFGADSGESFDEAVNYLKDFIERRIAFFDETFSSEK